MLDVTPTSPKYQLDAVDLAKIGIHSTRVMLALGIALAVLTVSIWAQQRWGIFLAPVIAGAGAYAQDIYRRIKRGWNDDDTDTLARNASVAVGSIFMAYFTALGGSDVLPTFVAPLLPMGVNILLRLVKNNALSASGTGTTSVAAAALIFLALSFPATANAQFRRPCLANSTASPPTAPALACDLPENVRVWYHNPDGSCVQCSIGMLGANQNVPAAATLLWDTEYGPAERGGSSPGRVAAYCNSRKIPAWNVTGQVTWEWMAWAVDNGRGAAIGAGTAHFQTLVGRDRVKGLWYVCNNQTPRRIDVYDDAAFRRLHLASGQWCVILDAPPAAPRPKFVKWWE